MRQANYKELEKVLRKEIPNRPTLFEFYLNERLERLACKEHYDTSSPLQAINTKIAAFLHYGYDYATVRGS